MFGRVAHLFIPVWMCELGPALDDDEVGTQPSERTIWALRGKLLDAPRGVSLQVVVAHHSERG